MRSRTSCFDKTIYRKNLRRFWPVSFCGILLWFLLEPVYFLSHATNPASRLLDLRYHLVNSMCAETHIIWFFFSVACAMAVFSWLYNERSVGFMASLPLTRENLFFTCYLSGLSMLLSCLLLIGGLMLLISLICEFAVLDLIGLWMLESLLDILGFYGFATLCAMLTGNLVIMPLCTLVLEFCSVVVEELARYLMGSMLFGYTSTGGILAYASPLWTLCRKCRSEPLTSEAGLTTDVVFHGMGLVSIYALCGVLFTLLALRLFRNRRMESAGDTVAIAILKPVFRWCMALGCALVLAVTIYDLTLQGRYVPCTGGYLVLLLSLLLLGGLVGWFGADMLIQKSFRVFKLHAKGALLLSALLLCFGLTMGLDLFGLEKRVPRREQFDTVHLSCEGECVQLDEEESLVQVLKLHESIISHKSDHERGAVENYKLLSIDYYQGEKCVESRRYYLAANRADQSDRNSDLRFTERVLNLSESILERKSISVPVTENTIEYASVNQWEFYYSDTDGPAAKAVATREIQTDPADESAYYFGACRDFSSYEWRLSPREAYELYTECILPDLQEGTLGRIWLVKDEEYARTIYNIRFEMSLDSFDLNGNSYSSWFYTVPTIYSKRTNAWLSEHGVVLETYWDYLERLDGLDAVR